jgi:hypothetical protein
MNDTPSTVSQQESEQMAARLSLLWQRHCDCAGPQPGRSGARLDEHAPDCPYRVKAEMDYDIR